MATSKKSIKLITDYIKEQITFTWESDIIEHTLWGFRSAPYKSFERAKKAVKQVIADLESKGAINVEKVEGYADRITVKEFYLI